MTKLGLFTAIHPKTGADTSQVVDATFCDCMTVATDNLTGDETVTLYVMCGDGTSDTPRQVTDIYGTAINLTAATSSVALEGGARYKFTKSVTAGACGVYYAFKQF